MILADPTFLTLGGIILVFSFFMKKLLHQLPAIIIFLIGLFLEHYGRRFASPEGTGFEGATPIFLGYFIMLLGLGLGIFVLCYKKR